MAFREIPGHSNQAIFSGCFFLNDGGAKEIRDDITGELRRERIFTSDRFIEYEDAGILELSERAAKQIAHTLGWVSPKKNHEQALRLTAIREERRILKEQVEQLAIRNEALIAELIARETEEVE